MLTLDIERVHRRLLGENTGLDVETVFREHQERVGSAISQLYANKDKAGQWSKWLNLGYNEAMTNEIRQYATSVKGKFTDLVILGIGGSSLGGYAMLKALLHPYWNDLPADKRLDHPRFHFIENVDSDQINGLLDVLDLKTTLFNVISKSGTTAETMSAFMLAKERLEKALPADQVKHHIVATTDKQKGILRDIANVEGYQTFEVPDDVGGRFSVFSAVGLLPAALCGIDLAELQRGIKDLDALCQKTSLNENPAAQNALLQTLFYERGQHISVLMPYSYRLASVSDWYVQLWAESLGKKKNLKGQIVNMGPTPLRAVGVTDQHSQVQLFNEGPYDKVFTFINVLEPNNRLTIPHQFADIDDLAYMGGKTFQELMQSEFQATRASLTNNGRPSVTITLPKLDAYYFAQLLYFFEVQTAIAGQLLEIDPFDQPGVELAKQYTHALMGRQAYQHLLPEITGTPVASR